MADNHKTMRLIETRLREAFLPTDFELIDESYLHVGHAGATSGKGHYAVIIRSVAFGGKSPIQRHKMVYEALGELMETHIHALSIKAEP